MGVEYIHHLLVPDLEWIPQKVHGERIHQVLGKWRLILTKPQLHDATGGKKRHVRGKQIEESGKIPDNLVMVYPEVVGAAIERVVGPSYYPEEKTGERSFAQVVLRLGLDYRVCRSDMVHTLVTEPPRIGTSEVVSRTDADGETFYPGSRSTQAPVAKLEAGSPVPAGFQGVWRSGLTLDFGKHLPGFLEKVHELPARDFVHDLERAFGTKLVEIGWHY